MSIRVSLHAVPGDESTWWWRRFLVEIPEGRQGQWAVRRFTVTPEQAAIDQLRNSIRGTSHRSVAPDTYTAIEHQGEIVMSDTPAEIKDHLSFFENMRGDILIFGLGIGMAAKAALEDPEVKSVRVVEIDPDVIALTAPTLLAKYGDKLTVVQADAFTYHKKCRDKFDAVWHDIWPTICADNLPEMAKLKRSWARRAGWQGFWARIECLRSQRRYG